MFVFCTLDVTDSIGPLCIVCQNAATVEECRQQNKVHCGDNEDCYLKKYTTNTAQIRFEAGCFPKTTCVLLNSLNPSPVGKRDTDLHRPKKDLTNCFQCCNGTTTQDGPCNSYLCHQDPTAELVTCKVCTGVHDHIESCAHEDVCPPTEACYTGIRIVGNEAKYVFGCANKRICRSLALDNARQARVIHGDVGLNICDACCVGTNCNEAECFTLKKEMKYADYKRNTTSTTTSTLG
ncbi:uncharacterized protein LOC125660007 isoform X2 [Ostrea edulis]|uniref:uncharacterized protein LOC125660007 isoform X2 n=1 Tax=Ostrea edulis TaxID=37623 RepID=UPI0024AFC6B4|nr:uncharacterized protein LOC125660007 isoform X2 [Ostrea edulis]